MSPSKTLSPKNLSDDAFLEMRWRCLSLAADLDRLDCLDRGGTDSDARLLKLREAIGVLLDGRANRAERVQLIFTDHTPPDQTLSPPYGKTSQR